MADYKANIDSLTKKIESVCLKVSRNPAEIKVIAASKYSDAAGIIEAAKLGIKNFGENRADELLEKYSIIGSKVCWHFIGHLQSRKARMVVPVAEYIHSIDTVSTLEKVNREAVSAGKIQKVLLEVNISGESTKYGIDDEQIDFFLKDSDKFGNIKIKGFMTMAPLTDDSILVRSIFSKLKRILEDKNRKFPAADLKELSMGMSADFEIAIEEGATMVRIGSLIFK